ncbi:tape measure protein [Aquipseudomonas alcaligenes]
MEKIELVLTADASGAKTGINGLRKEYDELARTLNKPLKQIDAFRQTQESAKAASSAYFAARKRVEDLQRAISQAGQPVKELNRDFKLAERQLLAATRVFDQQKAAIRSQRAELKASGVDVRSLASEQQRLTAELAKRTDGLRGQSALGDAAGNLGVARLRAQSAAIQQARRDYELLRKSGTLTARELAVAQEALNRKIRESSREMQDLAGARAGIGGSLAGRLTGAVSIAGAAYGSVSALRAYAQITDSSKKMTAQLKIATSSQEEFARAQKDTYRIAQEAQVPVEEVVSTYARLAPALDQIGRRKDTSAVVELLTKALQLNGSTAAEASGALLQFSQAMSTGVLRGDEFNSVADAAPPLLRAYASALKVPTGAITAMAKEGLLTAEVITDLSVQALPALAEEASKLPATVDGALTRLRNDALKAFGDGDTSGLIGAINKLRDLLSDPQVVQGLNDLAGGMATFAGWTVQAANEFTRLGKEIAFATANANGYVAELDKVEKTLEGVRNAKDGGSFIGRPTFSLFLSDSELDAWIKELEDKQLELQAKIAGMSVEAYKASIEASKQATEQKKAAAEEQQKIEEESYSEYSKYIANTLKVQKEGVAGAEKFLKQHVQAERKAAKEIEDAKKLQLDTQKRYTEALNKLQSGSSGEASFGQAQDLRLQARQALRDGDVEKAKSSAQAALKVLSDLQDAGENTYGFAGFIKSLKAIEDEADKVTLDKAEKGAADALALVAQVKDELDKVNKTVISVKLDDVALDKARQELRDLATLTGQTITLPERVANPQASRSKSASALAAGIDPTYGAPKAKDEPVATVPVAVKPTAIVQDGENSYSNLPPVGIDVQVDQEAAAVAQQAITSLSTQFRQQMVIPVVPVVQGAAPAPSDTDVPKFATGGILRGAGSGTSDSLLIRASNGEGIIRAAAVRHYGADAIHKLNALRVPKFATGGVLGERGLPAIPPLAPSLEGSGGSLADYGSLQINLPDGTSIPAMVQHDTAKEIRRLARMRGKSSTR